MAVLRRHIHRIDFAGRLRRSLHIPVSLRFEVIHAGPKDVQKFRDYVANHNWKAVSARENAPVALGFGRTVRKYDKLKLAVPDSLVMSFIYQRKRVSSDAERAWAQGLLKQFDAQRQRILMSIVQEPKFSTLWAPEDTAAGIADTLVQVRQPDFETRVAEEVKGVAP